MCCETKAPEWMWEWLYRVHEKVHEQVARDWWGEPVEEQRRYIEDYYNIWCEGGWAADAGISPDKDFGINEY